jgi:AcrR family transcriptional regulator
MPVNTSVDERAPEGGHERADQLLAAACRVLTRGGTRGLNLRDVAEEAGVSKTLIHYYFTSRDDLLVKAYEFADQRGRARVRELLPSGGTAVDRLHRLMRLYIGGESEIREDWLLWTELSSAALFEPELRPVMESSFQRWSEWIESFVHDAIIEGALEPSTDPATLALRLIVFVDGLGSLLVRQLIDYEQARATLDAMLARELGLAEAPSENGPEHAIGPSSAYLRQLADLARGAVGGLELVAEDAADTAALRTVHDLIDRAVGLQPGATRDGRDAGDA